MRALISGMFIACLSILGACTDQNSDLSAPSGKISGSPLTTIPPYSDGTSSAIESMNNGDCRLLGYQDHFIVVPNNGSLTNHHLNSNKVRLLSDGETDRFTSDQARTHYLIEYNAHIITFSHEFRCEPQA